MPSFKGFFLLLVWGFFLLKTSGLCLSLIYHVLDKCKGSGIIYGWMDSLNLSLLGGAKAISFIVKHLRIFLLVL